MGLRDRNLVPDKKAPVSKTSILLGAFGGLVLAFLARALIHWLWIFPLVVDTSSMVPALAAGRTVYVNRRGDLAFGTVVLYRHENGGYLIGRLAGLPAERVAVKDRVLYRNGARVTEAWQAAAEGGAVLPETVYPRDGAQEITLGKDLYYVLCDSRDRCMDSRILGPVPRERIVGTIAL